MDGVPWDQAFEIRFVIPIRQEQALIWTESRISLEVHAHRGWCGKNKPRAMSNCFALNPLVDASGKRILWVALLRHGIAEIHDPRLAAKDMQEISDQYRGGNRIRSEDDVNVVLPDAIQSRRNCSGKPGDPAIGKGTGAQVASAQREMPLRIQAECPDDVYIGRDLSHLGAIGPLIGARIDRQHTGQPAEFRKISAEFQRPQQSAAARLRRKVVSDNEYASANSDRRCIVSSLAVEG